MGILAASLSTISTFYPEAQNPNRPKEAIDLTIYRLLAKVPTLAAWAYKNAVGQPVVYPKNKYDYCENFVNMMFSLPAYEYSPDPVVVNALINYLFLHADHEQNCSASTVRIVGSSQANLYALFHLEFRIVGTLHGGANQAVIEMLEKIMNDGGGLMKWINKAKDKKILLD